MTESIAKRFAVNLLGNSATQLAQALVPLLTLPYLARTVGLEGLGQIALAQVFIAYFALMADFGIGALATRDATTNKSNSRRLHEIVIEVLIARALLALGVTPFLIYCVAAFEPLRAHWELYLATSGLVIAAVLNTNWLYQGLERMLFYARIALISRLIGVALTFLLVKDSKDLIIVPAINVSVEISIGIIGYVALQAQKNGIPITSSVLAGAKNYIRSSSRMFFSQLLVNVYGSTNSLVLGLVAPVAELGAFTIANKIFSALAAFANLITQAIFPYLVERYNEERAKYFVHANRLIVLLGIVLSIFSIGLFVFAETLIHLVNGTPNVSATMSLQIMAPAAVMSGFGGLLTYLTVLHTSLGALMRAVTVGAAISLATVFPAASEFGAPGVAFVTVLSQAVVVCLLFWWFKRQQADYV